MKKTVLFLLIMSICGCSQSDSIYSSGQAQNVVWSDKQKTVNFYENYIGNIHLDETETSTSLSYEQIDAMLYLSYIYLTDNEYKDITKANKLINVAKKAIWQDCDGYHGHYDNFCYFQYYQDEIPTFVNNLNDAIIIYQMTLPCVYIDMIQENEKAIDIIDDYFGSSRDANIPALCDEFNPHHVVNTDGIASLEDYIFLKNLNRESEIDGTMRFGLSRTRYHDFVYMLTYPAHYFKTDKFEDVHIEQFDIETNTKTKFFAYQLEQEIYKHPDLQKAYNKMIESLKRHYESFLKMNSADAANYARMAASMLILQDIFIR